MFVLSAIFFIENVLALRFILNLGVENKPTLDGTGLLDLFNIGLKILSWYSF